MTSKHNTSENKQHWLIRVGDGDNFRNSKYPFWGIKNNKTLKSIITKRFKKGDIIWFITSKPYGGKAIGFAEYSHCYDREDEPLIDINTFTNKEQNWEGDTDWSIQLHYDNLYITERQDIKIIIQCASTILNYETFKNKIRENLNNEYLLFKFYAEPKNFI
jgi:hypothetical protein